MTVKDGLQVTSLLTRIHTTEFGLHEQCSQQSVAFVAFMHDLHEVKKGIR